MTDDRLTGTERIIVERRRRDPRSMEGMAAALRTTPEELEEMLGVRTAEDYARVQAERRAPEGR